MREYLVIYKDLILKYDLKKAIVLQYIIDLGGEYIGCPRKLTEELAILTYQKVSIALRELVEERALKRSKVTARTYKYVINEDLKNYEEKSAK